MTIKPIHQVIDDQRVYLGWGISRLADEAGLSGSRPNLSRFLAGKLARYPAANIDKLRAAMHGKEPEGAAAIVAGTGTVKPTRQPKP